MPPLHVNNVYKYKQGFDDDLTNDPELEADKAQIFEEFKAYLKNGDHLASQLSGMFGRDELYDHPNTPSLVKQSRLRHVHIVPLDAISRVRRKYDATSDVHLVYCIDDLTGYACALALIQPAHRIAKSSKFLCKLAEYAESFYRQAPNLKKSQQQKR